MSEDSDDRSSSASPPLTPRSVNKIIGDLFGICCRALQGSPTTTTQPAPLKREEPTHVEPSSDEAKADEPVAFDATHFLQGDSHMVKPTALRISVRKDSIDTQPMTPAASPMFGAGSSSHLLADGDGDEDEEVRKVGAEVPADDGSDPYPKHPHNICMYLDGMWFELSPIDEVREIPEDPVSSLGVQVSDTTGVSR